MSEVAAASAAPSSGAGESAAKSSDSVDTAASAAPSAPAPSQPSAPEAPPSAPADPPATAAPPDPTQAQPPQPPQSILSGVLDGELGAPDAQDSTYEYDYDDIQLENGLIGADADKATTNAIARELGLSREQARKLYERGGAIVREQQQAQQAAQIQEWNQQIQSDPEVGGANLQGAIADARKAISTFGSPELQNLLRQYPLHEVPEVFKFFAKAGKAISGDNHFTQGDRAVPSHKSESESFLQQFPNSGYLLSDDFRQ